jgi:hypothetical protein
MMGDIATDAWEIVATTFRQSGMLHDGEDVADIATTVAFSENLLRSILSLRSDQQTELVRRLARGIFATGFPDAICYPKRYP